MYLPPQTSSCHELIGTPYRLGGGEGYIDCIQMVYVALGHMKIPTPAFDPAWYEQGRIRHLRDLLHWGRRVSGCSYDGDVLLFSGQTPDVRCRYGKPGHFTSVRVTEKVNWCPLSKSGRTIGAVRYCPTKKN